MVNTTSATVDDFAALTDARMRAVRDVLLAWGGIPDRHSASDPWLEFTCEAARHVAQYLDGDNATVDDDAVLSDPEIAVAVANAAPWAAERAAWEACLENRRHIAARLCADLDLAGNQGWYAAVATPAHIDAEADVHANRLLAETGRAAAKAYFVAYMAAVRAYFGGDAHTRDLILSPYV